MGNYLVKIKNICFNCARCMLDVEKALEEEKGKELTTQKFCPDHQPPSINEN